MWTRIWCSGKFFPVRPSEKQSNPTSNLPSSSEEVRAFLVSLLSSGLFPEVVFRLHFCVNFLGFVLSLKKKKKRYRQKLPTLGQENFASSWFSRQPETLGAMYSAVTPRCIEDPITYRNHRGGDRKFGMKFAGFTREWLPAVHPELLHQQEFLW